MSLMSYREMYEEACRLAGRETWEPVEQSVLLEVLDEVGIAWYVENGHIEDDWLKTDPDETDEPLWYYPSGNEPRIREFKQFQELLIADAPEGYEPYYIRVEAAGKAPATEYGGWKSEHNRLSYQEALEWMRKGGNIGIAGTPDDALVNLDIDDEDEASADDVPTTLRARSRSRAGFHAWYFVDGDFPEENIPTRAGELRMSWQYVVAPGSFVASLREDIAIGSDSPGYYTVEDYSPVASLQFGDLPEVFRNVRKEADESDEEEGSGLSDESENSQNDSPVVEPSESRRSVLYDITTRDIVNHVGGSTDSGDRWGSPWHKGSDNTRFADGKIQCWRCDVSHGALQALTLICDEGPSGENGCKKVGAGHKNSAVGSNRLKDDWRLSWYAWLGAKTEGLIPDEDPVPYVVIEGLADEYGLMMFPNDHDRSDRLPAATYNAVLYLIEDEYGVDPGRDPVGRDRDRRKGEAKAAKETAEDEDEEIVASLMDDML